MLETIKENIGAIAVLIVFAIGANLIFGVPVVFVVLFIPLVAIYGAVLFGILSRFIGPELAGFGLWPFVIGALLAGLTLTQLGLSSG